MSYGPGSFMPMPPMVSTGSYGISAAAGERPSTSAAASAAFESANRAAYAPILIPATCVVRRLWWVNGATVSASYNVDCGIYRDANYAPGALAVSTGSTAQGTASEVQFVDVADTVLGPGLYWLALASSSTSATFFRFAMSVAHDHAFRFEEASALPLPATATPAESSNTSLYLCGFATTASP